jgi:hypothetical protein
MPNYFYNSFEELREVNNKRFTRLAYRVAFHREPSTQTIDECCGLLNLREINHAQLIKKFRKDAESIVVNHFGVDVSPVLNIETLISRIRNEINTRR